MAFKTFGNHTTPSKVQAPIQSNIPFVPEYNPNVYSSKSSFTHTLVSTVREEGGIKFWVLNKQYYEIYEFRATQVSDFDVAIDLVNSLEGELVLSVTFVLHMKDKITELLDEIPGKVYLKKLECYRELYHSLLDKVETIKSKDKKLEMLEKIDYIESTFPELLI